MICYGANFEPWGLQMRRREFIAGIGAIAWPLAARAQQSGNLPVIGFLGSGLPAANSSSLSAFRQGLAESGYVECQNVSIEFRWPNAQGGTLQGAAADLARRQVAVIVASGAVETALAAKAASSTIPIVVAVGGDPVKYGLAASLNRPGGNITGVTLLAYALAAKRLSLLHDIVPRATTVAYLSGGSRALTFEDQKANVLAAARELGMQVVVQEARSERDFEPAFAAFVSHGAGMLIVGTFTLFLNNREKIAALAAANKIPAIYPSAAYAHVGGLMSYSADAASGLHQAGIYVGQILKGAKPADLPVHLPTKFQFVINRNTANALGLAIPSGLLAQTGELIE
jgi:putative ABC transport system substrate-binding protein